MNKDTFLSIDLDYWNCVSWDWREDTDIDDLIDINKLFSEIKRKNIPIEIHWEHHHMVPQINKSKCKNIINLDFHSDLADDSHNCGLTEGTVFNYIDDLKEKTFTWIMPYREVGYIGSNGRCDSECNVFYKPNWIFKKQKKTIIYKSIKLDKIKEVGVSISPNWITYDSYQFIEDVILPLCSGKLKEDINKLINHELTSQLHY